MDFSVVFASIVLSFFLSFEANLIKFLDLRQYNVPFEQIVVLVEIFKFVVSLCFYYGYSNGSMKRPNVDIVVESYSEYLDDFFDANESLISEAEPDTWNWGNIHYYLLPAAVYTISNNVTYLALGELTPAMYNLLMNLKIPFTGILAYFFLSYRITGVFVFSYILLTASTVFASLKIQETVSLDTTLLGLVYMLVYTSCSASGAVLMELLTKVKFGNTSIYIQNVKFALMNILCNLIVIAIRFEIPFNKLNWVHLMVIVVSGMYGLITAVVIKYGGSILKTYSVSVSVFISAFFSYMIWGIYYTWNFYVGSVLCMLAVYLYSREYQKIKSNHMGEDIDIESEN